MRGVDQGIPNAGPAQAAGRSYAMHVIELQRLEMESADEEGEQRIGAVSLGNGLSTQTAVLGLHSLASILS